MTANPSYCLQRYLLMTLDPIHPGAGGYRLGRVDNSITRDPGTRLPKIPGSSLHGAARQYADLQARMDDKQEICAGQNSCGKSECPICYTFGTVKKDKEGNEQIARSGVVSIFDAHILFFPVHTMLGPMWVSTVERLKEADFTLEEGEPAEDSIWLTRSHEGRLTLGWLILNVEKQVSLTPPKEWQNEQWNAIQDKIALVNESLFSVIVNSNLEVRTSVSIDPKTGAAADKALYTYEAIPRATFLTVEVVQNDYRSKFPADDDLAKKLNWQQPLDVVQAGLKMMEYLGVGGMGTRGFGRIRLIGEPLELPIFKDKTQEAAA